VQALQPSESETAAISNHVIICGFGRVGQMIAELLSKKMIPFVALDVRTDRVQVGAVSNIHAFRYACSFRVSAGCEVLG
jgi:voltage-gated potassium channel Kch